MSSPLLNCPSDVLHIILKHLGREELYALCLTCKGLRPYAEPFLYSEVRWEWTKNKAPPIVPLLQTIVRRPELADLVQNVYLLGKTFQPGHTYHKLPNPQLQVTSTDVETLVECVTGLNVSYRHLWTEALTSGDMDAFVALLLCLLPNLRFLRMEENFTRKSWLVGMMLRSALCEGENPFRTRFEHLLSVDAIYPELGIDVRDFTDARNTVDVLPFFYLPSIEHLTTLIDNQVGALEWPSAHPPSPVKLRSLDLAMIREGHLGELLSVTSRLERLQWSWYYRPDLRDRWVTDIIDLEKIAADLSVVETLTELTIDAGSDTSRADPEFPHLTIKGVGSFRCLHNLKRLQVPFALLLGFEPSDWDVKLADVLPPNTEVLTITDGLYFQSELEWSDVEILQALSIYMQDWKSCTPHLKTLHIFWEFMENLDWPPERSQQLKDVGSRAGIEIKITMKCGR